MVVTLGSTSSPVFPGLSTGLPATRPWGRALPIRLLVTDALVVASACASAPLVFAAAGDGPGPWRPSNLAAAAALTCLWLLVLAAFGTRDHRILGADGSEYRRTISATVYLCVATVLAEPLLDSALIPRYPAAIFALGLPALLASRWAWRRWLVSQRQAHGRFSFLVVLIGSASATTALARELARDPGSGYKVLGACVSQATTGTLHGTDVPVLGGIADATTVLRATEADTLMIASGDDMPPESITRLGWELDRGEHLIVVPSVAGVRGSRVHTRPVSDLPLLHLTAPSFDGPKRYMKRGFDLIGSGALLLVLSLVMASVALAVHLADRGPVFYRQERIGRGGVPFDMLKFRSMRVGADAELAALLRAQGTDNVPLFKVASDPRVTRVGNVLRRYSLDELPQLFNVLAGEMSLVGPRPQRAGEVELYEGMALRRLAVKPGMSGLWQVSGRSRLTWEDAIRLDISYVENWSMTGDLRILFRTARAVLTTDGAE